MTDGNMTRSNSQNSDLVESHNINGPVQVKILRHGQMRYLPNNNSYSDNPSSSPTLKNSKGIQKTAFTNQVIGQHRARINSASPQDPFSPISPMSPPFDIPPQQQQQRYTPYQKPSKRKPGLTYTSPDQSRNIANRMTHPERMNHNDRMTHGNRMVHPEKSFEPPISSNNRSLQSSFRNSNLNQIHLRDQGHQFQSRQRFNNLNNRQQGTTQIQTQQSPQMYNNWNGY